MKLDLYYQLPLEIQSKIMYSGWIVHPVAKIFKDFYEEEKFYLFNQYDIENDRYIECDLYSYLKGIEFLKDTEEIFLELFVDHILFLHME